MLNKSLIESHKNFNCTNRKFLILFLFFLPFSISAQDLSFQQLEKAFDKEIFNPSALSAFDGKEITMKGFVVTLANNKRVLAPTPNLKSCCQTGTSLKKNLILLTHYDALSSSPAVQTLSGIFSLSASPEEEGTYFKLTKKII